jgi:maltose/moltooligosaccharide transporter
MPYTILSGALPAKRMGIYMGLFNLTVVVPQILSGVFGGPILRTFFNGNGIYILVLAGVIMILGAISVFFVRESDK